MNLGKAIKDKRKSLWLSQTYIGDVCNFGHNQLSLIENGKVEPTISTLQRLCKVFGCSVWELIKEAETNQQIN